MGQTTQKPESLVVQMVEPGFEIVVENDEKEKLDAGRKNKGKQFEKTQL